MRVDLGFWNADFGIRYWIPASAGMTDYGKNKVEIRG